MQFELRLSLPLSLALTGLAFTALVSRANDNNTDYLITDRN